MDRLPHNPEAEAALMGEIIANGARAFEEASQIVGDRALYVPVSRSLWDAFRSLAEEGRAIDRVTVEAKMRERGTLEQIGGSQGIASVEAKACNDINRLRAHASLIAEAQQAREAGVAARELADDLLGKNSPTGDQLVARIATAADLLSDIQRNGAGGSMPWHSSDVGEQSRRERESEADGETMAISTGFPRLDYLFKRRGPRPGWVVVVAGRPKMGKTSVALQMVLNSVLEVEPGFPQRYRLKEHPTPVLYACDEMRAVELYDRMLANVAGLDATALGSPTRKYLDYYADRIAEAERLLAAAPIHFVPDEHAGSLPKIYGYARRWRSRHAIVGRDNDGRPVRRPALLCLDYLQEFDDLPGTERANEQERIGRKIKMIKKNSKRMGIVTLLISQLNRDLEKRDDKRPRASDNKGSGSIEQYADALVGCYRDVVYDEKAEAYRERLAELRDKAIANAAARGRPRPQAAAELDEIVWSHRAGIEFGPEYERLCDLEDACELSPDEITEMCNMSDKLTDGELIVQRNRHGPEGTVYAHFQGAHYQWEPQTPRTQ